MNTENNQIFSNFFLNNSISHALDNGINNHWNNSFIGNYWDNYTGEDLDDNGIGDTPYKFIFGSSVSKDFLPIWRDKDDLEPQISIKFPFSNFLVGKQAPDFEIEIIDQTLNSTWYRLWNGTVLTANHSFNYLIETSINQVIWNQVGNGSVVISFSANDSIGRISYENITIRKEIINPTWDQIPSNQTNEYGTNFNYDLNATDPSGIDSFWINDTDNFQINSNGFLSNLTHLSIGNYWLKVFVNDTIGNLNSCQIELLVQDTTCPKWIRPISNQTIEYGTNFYYDLNATDLSGIESFWVNDTNNFKISIEGVIRNATTLEIGIYWIEVQAFDPYGNYVTQILKMTVYEQEGEEPTTQEINGYSLFFLMLVLSIYISLKLFYIKNKKIKFF